MKKSQIQMGETIAVLFVFFILIMIGFIFYVSFIKSGIEAQKGVSSQLMSIQVAQRVMFMPELQCSEDNIIEDNCIDILKLDATRSLINVNSVFYYDLLGYGEITVREIYPQQASWQVYSRVIEDFQANYSTNIPISLYDSAHRKRSFGVLTVDSLSK